VTEQHPAALVVASAESPSADAKQQGRRVFLPGGQYYERQDDGHMMLCNADGTRSIFDDVDE
jgi:hypothetical protein